MPINLDQVQIGMFLYGKATLLKLDLALHTILPDLRHGEIHPLLFENAASRNPDFHTGYRS